MNLSVIIPIYNSEKTLERSLISILEQDLQANEIICCLNQCTDSSKEILQKFASENGSIKIIEQNSCKGIVPTLNKCLYNLNKDCTFIARMDADDRVCEINRFSKQIKFFEENSEIDILGTQMRVVSKSNYLPTGIVTSNPLHDSDIKNNMLNSHNAIAHPSVIFKTKILERLGGYSDVLKYTEDFDLWLRASRWYKFANLPDIMVDYTQSNNPDYNPKAPQILSWNMKQLNMYFPI